MFCDRLLWRSLRLRWKLDPCSDLLSPTPSQPESTRRTTCHIEMLTFIFGFTNAVIRSPTSTSVSSATWNSLNTWIHPDSPFGSCRVCPARIAPPGLFAWISSHPSSWQPLSAEDNSHHSDFISPASPCSNSTSQIQKIRWYQKHCPWTEAPHCHQWSQPDQSLKSNNKSYRHLCPSLTDICVVVDGIGKQTLLLRLIRVVCFSLTLP